MSNDKILVRQMRQPSDFLKRCEAVDERKKRQARNENILNFFSMILCLVGCFLLASVM